MSLSERMLEAASKPRKSTCSLLEATNELSKEDKEYLVSILDTPVGAPERLNNSVIARVLRSEGLGVTNASVDRHRRGECACKEPIQ